MADAIAGFLGPATAATSRTALTMWSLVRVSRAVLPASIEVVSEPGLENYSSLTADFPIISCLLAARLLLASQARDWRERAGRARVFPRAACRGRRGFWLEYASMAWMTDEAAVAITVGVTASSIALVGFGLDSVIKFFAAAIVV